MEFKNIFYFTHINKIGGVESFYWYLAQKYQDWDIAIVYNSGDDNQIERLRQYVKVFKFNGQRIKCEKAFFNYSTDIISYVDAQEYIQIIHGDYKGFHITPNVPPQIDRVIGVSQLVCDTFHEVTGLTVEKAYNPIVVPKTKKILHLISATRLTMEKGKKRMKTLASLLDANDIPYVWTIYTDDVDAILNPNIVYRKPRLDIINYIADSDYLVQLSDHEGYCYAVAEALSVGTPVIVTDCPVFREIGVNEKNGFILDHEMTNVPVKEIYKGISKFEYKPLEDHWGDLLAKGESQYKKDLKTNVKIRCIREYYDLVLQKQMKKGDVFSCNKVRAEMLIDRGFADGNFR